FQLTHLCRNTPSSMNLESAINAPAQMLLLMIPRTVLRQILAAIHLMMRFTLEDTQPMKSPSQTLVPAQQQSAAMAMMRTEIPTPPAVSFKPCMDAKKDISPTLSFAAESLIRLHNTAGR